MSGSDPSNPKKSEKTTAGLLRQLAIRVWNSTFPKGNVEQPSNALLASIGTLKSEEIESLKYIVDFINEKIEFYPDFFTVLNQQILYLYESGQPIRFPVKSDYVHGTLQYPEGHDGPEDRNELESYDETEFVFVDEFWETFNFLNYVTSPSEKNLYEVVDGIRSFRDETLEKLQAALNEYLGEIALSQRPEGAKGRPVDLINFTHKQQIVALVNTNLEKLGLAIKYQGHPCYLTCLKGTSEGRFALVPKGHNAPLLARSNLSDFLPLELMDATKSVDVAEFARREHERRNSGKAPVRE